MKAEGDFMNSIITALKKIEEELPHTEEVMEFINFCKNSKKGVIAAKVDGHRA